MKCVCGNEGCNGLCDVAVGLRLAVLIGKTDKLETHIGEKAQSSCGNDYTYCGAAIDMDDGISKMLVESNNYKTDIDTGFTVDVVRLLSQFSSKDISSIGDIIQSAESIMSGASVITPIKTKTDVLLKGEHTRRGKVKAIGVKLNSDGKIEQFIKTKNTTGTGVSLTSRIPLTEYCESFEIEAAENMRKSSKYERLNLMKMTDTGYIRPIEFIDKDVKLLVDGVSVYISVGDETKEVFRLADISKSNGDEAITASMHSEIQDKRFDNLVKCLAVNYKYIYSHRKWIAPVGTAETFKIDIQKK